MKHEEFSLHKTVAAYLRLAVEDSAAVWWHTPNGGGRSVREGVRLKAMGTKPGVPDLAFALPGGRLAFIELKRDSKARLSQPQKEFTASVSAHGVETVTCASLQDVIAALERWGVKLKAKI